MASVEVELSKELTDAVAQAEQFATTIDRCKDEEAVQSSSYADLSIVLDRLANALREDEQRIPLGRTSLPSSLVLALRHCAQLLGPVDVKFQCLGQVGRVAANLAADCDPNRNILVKEGYLDAALRALKLRSDLPTPTLRSIVASVLNMVIDGHEPSINSLANWEALGLFFGCIESLRRPDQTEDIASTEVQWLWKIVTSVILEDADASMISGSPSYPILNTISRPLSAFLPSSPAPQHDVLQILTSSTELLEVVASAEDLDSQIFFVRGEEGRPIMTTMVDFVEQAEIPSEWRDTTHSTPAGPEEENETSFTESEKEISGAKECIVRAIIEVCAARNLSSIDSGEFRSTIGRWLQLEPEADRQDLVMCSLLCFGNMARSDESAINLLQDEKSPLLPNILPTIIPSTPLTVQHALFGLLKNLSIPLRNKTPLGEAGIIERIFEMDPFSSERDIVGSIQGGAIGVLKNLCRDNVENVERLMRCGDGVNSIFELLDRSDDQALKFEATRILVNCVRSTCKDVSAHQESVSRLSGYKVIRAFCTMLRLGGQYPVLMNESIIGLTLISTYGPRGTDDYVATKLVEQHNVEGDTPSNAYDLLRSKIQQNSADKLPDEITANVKTLFAKLEL